MSNSNDFPLVEAPAAGRKGVFSIAMVLFSFTFFTGTMFAGGKLGVSFSIVNLLWIAVIGNALLALYAASLGWIAARSGLNTVLMGRFCFGEIGSKLADFILGFAELGWYAWGTATVAISLVKILALPEALTQPLMVLFGILFCVTALVGYKGLDALSRLSVPLMFVLLMVSMYLALHHAGGWQAMTRIAPSDTMTWSAAITMVFGTFASGATQATNWTRLANSSRTAILASMGSFLIGNGLMIVAGAWCAIVYQQADIVEVLILQGLSVAAVIMLCLNLLTIQGPTIYNVSAAACHLLRSERRRTLTLAAAGVGIVLAIGGMYEMLIPFLVLLGMPLIEQPYLLKMVIVTERIGTALVRSENVLQSQRDILMQLVTGDYPDLQMLHQRALHQQLDFTRPLRLAALRLEGLSRLFRQFPPEQAEAWLLQAHRSVRQQLQQQLNQQGNSFPLLERSNMFLFLLPDEEGEGFQQKKWLQQWLQALADGEESLSLLCGLSAPVRQLQGYPRALSQARQALDLCDTLRPTQRISDYQQLGFIKLLSAVSDPALLNDFMHDTLGCLIEPGRKAPWLLLETLETLLQENGNVVRAADRLGLHRNTLHQRIQRIEKLTGYPVSHPQFHLNASVALVIWRLSQNHLQDPP